MKKGRWLRRFQILASILLVVGLFGYFNLRGIVVWFANRGDPLMALDLRRVALNWDRLELFDLVVKLRGSNEEVVRADSASVDFSWQGLREHRLGTVTVKKLRVRVTDGSLNAVRSETAESSASQVGATWQMEGLTVVDGKGEIDLVNEPLIRFSFAPKLDALQLGADTRSTTPQQTVALENIELLSRDPKSRPFGHVNRIELKFAQPEAEKLRFDELTIQAPSFQITPGALKALAPTAGLAPVSGTNSGANTGKVPNFRIGKVRIENGEAFIKDFGEAVPEGSLKFGMETADFELGESGTALEKEHAFEIWDVRLAPPFAPLTQIATIDSFEIKFTPAGLLQRQEIARTTLTGMSITMGQAFRSLMNAGNKESTSIAAPPPAPAAATPGAIPAKVSTANRWRLRELNIVNSRLTLADLGIGTTSVGFNVETTLKDIPLSLAMTDAAEEIQQQEISDFTVTSPLDSFAPVFTMKTLFIRYSIGGLLRREVDQVQILNPTIYVGEDLFWYFDELSKREGETPTTVPAAAAQPPESGWKLKKIGIAYGQLVIANGGKARLPLPIQFTSTAENLSLDRLSELKLALDLKVPQEDYVFPDYKLELRQLGGSIKFDLPPQTGQNNLVQTLRMKEVRWRQFRAEEGWLAVTFDSKGINGQIGAKGYGGYVNGGFTSFFGESSPWIGWLSGTKVDLKKVTDVMAPGNFVMDGPADFKLEVNGASSSLERLQGNVRTRHGGKMRITKLDQFLADIPSDWYWFKRESTRILLETLRDFTYDSGDASFWFLNDEGNLKLTLHGPLGSRNIDVVLHGADASNR